MKKKQKSNCEWWKILILLTFLMVLGSLIFDIEQKEVIKSKKFGTGIAIFNTIERYEILESVCVNANLYYPLSQPDKIWVEKSGSKRGHCYIIYRDTVNVLRFANHGGDK